MKIKNTIDVLRNELKRDEGYYLSWQANIAMAFYDEAKKNKVRVGAEKLHKISNEAAKNFLTLLCK